MTQENTLGKDTGTTRAKTRVRGFQDAEMDFQLMRSLSACYLGGGTAGEILSTAARIKDGDTASWAGEFGVLANNVETEGRAREEKKHFFTAGDQYLRACNYYRAAEYFAAEENPEKFKWGIRSRELLVKYLELAGYHFEATEIPYEDTPIPCIFISPDGSGKKRRTFFILNGFDGTSEESFIQGGKMALERDYNVFFIEGPGQAGMRRFHQESFFRPDYEVPLGIAIDWLLRKPEVVPENLCLCGLSFGGYFACRAAAYDNRIKALIANSPIVDLRAYLMGFLPPGTLEMMKDLTIDDINGIPDEMMPSTLKTNSRNLIIRFGKKTFGETFEYLKKFTMTDKLKDIRCPSLALYGEGEGGEPLKQTKEFCKNVSGPVTEYIFTVKQGADTHCQLGNVAFSCDVQLDWLDDIFNP